MKVWHKCIVSIALTISCTSSLFTQEPVYWDVVQQIMQEAFENSHVMENASWLTDVFGPRNAKSPGYIAAAKWARDRLQEYGLADAHLEPYEF
ncbi:MAG: peptidase M28, partial [Verrucomicrobia bacterium]|nr:peptidase M28 [Verrucomicrobiota bacterium]